MSKNVDAFRTISEVADELGLPQHVLRFWETRFNQIKPMKRGGGRRYYRPDDIDLLKGIKVLLYDEGYTIRGVQRLLKEQGNKLAIDIGRGEVLAGMLGTEASTENQGSGRKAVAVSEIGTSKAKRGKSLLGRLAGQRAGGGSDAKSGLGAKDLKALEKTMQELLECKRLLDQTRQG